MIVRCCARVHNFVGAEVAVVRRRDANTDMKGN
jgi:hypothetical protein